MEPGWLLHAVWTVIRRAASMVLVAGGVVALGWDAFALLVDLSAGQHWDAESILTVLGMAVGGLTLLGLAWLVYPHHARLTGPASWLNRHDPTSPPSPPSVPSLPTSPRPKFSE